jgi:hypothetical protein
MEWLKLLESRPELLVIAGLTGMVIWSSYRLLSRIMDAFLSTQREIAVELKESNLTQVRICERLDQMNRREKA